MLHKLISLLHTRIGSAFPEDSRLCSEKVTAVLQLRGNVLQYDFVCVSFHISVSPGYELNNKGGGINKCSWGWKCDPAGKLRPFSVDIEYNE